MEVTTVTLVCAYLHMVHTQGVYTHMTIALQLHADMHGGMSVMCVHLPRIGVANGLTK